MNKEKPYAILSESEMGLWSLSTPYATAEEALSVAMKENIYGRFEIIECISFKRILKKMLNN